MQHWLGEGMDVLLVLVLPFVLGKVNDNLSTSFTKTKGPLLELQILRPISVLVDWTHYMIPRALSVSHHVTDELVDGGVVSLDGYTVSRFFPANRFFDQPRSPKLSSASGFPTTRNTALLLHKSRPCVRRNGKIPSQFHMTLSRTTFFLHRDESHLTKTQLSVISKCEDLESLSMSSGWASWSIALAYRQDLHMSGQFFVLASLTTQANSRGLVHQLHNRLRSL